MNYTEMLNDLINNSGLTVKEIADKCQQEYGVNLTNSYLSTLKTTPYKYASPQISVAIAKACGAEYDQLLTVQACLDKAPETVIQFLNGVQNMMINPFPLEAKSEVSAMLEEISKEPLANFICRFAPQMDNLDKFRKEAEQIQSEPVWMMISPELFKNIILVPDSLAKKALEHKPD